MKGPEEKKKRGLFIDSHVHIMPKARIRGLVMWMKKNVPDHPVSSSATEIDLLNDIAREGVTHFFNLVYPIKQEETEPLNEFCARFCNRTPGAIPFAGIHQDTPNKAEAVAKAFDSYPFAGVKLHPTIQGFDPWDSCMDGLYAFLQEAGKPVILHTGFSELYGRPLPLIKLEKILKRFPRLTVVFAHSAFPEISDVLSMLDVYPELYLDATLVLPFNRPTYEPVLLAIQDGRREMEALAEGMEKYRGRIMYGSDYPTGMGIIHDIYRDLEDFPVSDEAKQSMRAEAPKIFVSRFLPDFDWNRSLDTWKNEKKGTL